MPRRRALATTAPRSPPGLRSPPAPPRSSPIEEAAALGRGDRRFDDRRATLESCFSNLSRAAPAPALRCEPPDRLGVLAPLPQIVGVIGLDKPTTHVGV
jgi:hypothetical protein